MQLCSSFASLIADSRKPQTVAARLHIQRLPAGSNPSRPPAVLRGAAGHASLENSLVCPADLARCHD